MRRRDGLGSTFTRSLIPDMSRVDSLVAVDGEARSQLDSSSRRLSRLGLSPNHHHLTMGLFTPADSSLVEVTAACLSFPSASLACSSARLTTVRSPPVPPNNPFARGKG